MGVLAAETLVGPKINWFALSPLLVLLGGARRRRRPGA